MDDGPADAALRARPPDVALAWVSRARGGAAVQRCEALCGGSSSAMHVLTLRDAQDRVERVVLRRYVLPAGTHEPDVATREAAALRLVEEIGVPTPALLAADPTGAEVGVPTLLMSELDGRPVWEPLDRGRWCRALAEALVEIHEVPVPESGVNGVSPVISAYAPHRQRSHAPPRWARDVHAWERAVEIALGPAVDAPACVVHRDFHPGNLLWVRGRLSGVVDWQHTSIGPGVVDVGHTRLNLFFADADLAESFTATWESVAGCTYDPWADIAAIVGALDPLRDTPPPTRARHAIEDALAAAVASVGG